MKATLTIEVPDDFEKGDAERCCLYVHDWSACAARRDYGDTNCCTDNCPLEIQENKNRPTWDKTVEFNLHCEMKERWTDTFISFRKEMERCGEIGHSEIIKFYADGDGDFRPKFTTNIDWHEMKPSKDNLYDAG